MIFKFLISSFILSSGVQLPDGDDWVSIERPEKIVPVEGADERDLSIWVVFSKQIGSEKILISFPDEPTYRYLGEVGEQIEVFSGSKGAEHRFQVLEKRAASLLDSRKKELAGAILLGESEDLEKGIANLSYWRGGYWHLERWVQSESHTYLLQTKSPDTDFLAHQAFIQSFHLDRF